MKTNTLTRSLNDYEHAILAKLLENSFPGRNELREQIKTARVQTLTEYKDNYGSIVFKEIKGEKANTIGRVPVEAKTIDQAGGPILILLHVIDGYIDELEFVRLDGKSMQGLADIARMEITIK